MRKLITPEEFRQWQKIYYNDFTKVCRSGFVGFAQRGIGKTELIRWLGCQ